MRKLSRFEREALSEWQTEMALYAQGDLTAGTREHLRWLMERSLETKISRQLGAGCYVPLLGVAETDSDEPR